MATIQQNLFSWQQVESSPEILRFERILAALDDEPLMAALEAARKGRRNDNPVRAMWNSLIAAVVFGHRSLGALRAELMRNGELRQACGFPLLEDEVRVGGLARTRSLAPSKHAYTRFLKSLVEHQALLDDIFVSLTARLTGQLPDFGRHLAIDGKAIVASRRDDPDARVGSKKQGHPDGDPNVEVTTHWLGYKLQLLCDATHELPVAFELTKANVNESPRMTGLIETMAARHEALFERDRRLFGPIYGHSNGLPRATNGARAWNGCLRGSIICSGWNIIIRRGWGVCACA